MQKIAAAANGGLQTSRVITDSPAKGTIAYLRDAEGDGLRAGAHFLRHRSPQDVHPNSMERNMKARMHYSTVAPGVRDAMLRLHEYLGQSGIEKPLLDLVYLRVSQINGCAYCLDMHWKDLRALGESEQKLSMLDAWREAPGFSDRERAALAWAEALTLITEGHVPDDVYQETREQFNEAELANLTLAVVSINGWNRLNIAFRTEAGNYKPAPGRRPAGASAR
jgi:AhpD family alkylhydroperoxidase